MQRSFVMHGVKSVAREAHQCSHRRGRAKTRRSLLVDGMDQYCARKLSGPTSWKMCSAGVVGTWRGCEAPRPSVVVNL